MTRYSPNAIALNEIGKPERLFTYYPCHTKVQCSAVIRRWAEIHGYKLLCSWIEVEHESRAKRIISMKTYRENFFG